MLHACPKSLKTLKYLEVVYYFGPKLRFFLSAASKFLICEKYLYKKKFKDLASFWSCSLLNFRYNVTKNTI